MEKLKRVYLARGGEEEEEEEEEEERNESGEGEGGGKEEVDELVQWTRHLSDVELNT